MKGKAGKGKERSRHQGAGGFTLTELLIVVAMMGLTMGAVFSVYQSHQKAAVTEEEVTEVQQNLRVAMGQMTRAISMAGFLVPSGTFPIGAVGNDTGLNGTDTLTLNTASSALVSARVVSATQDVTFATDDTFNLAVSDLGGYGSDDVNSTVVTVIGTQGSAVAVSNDFTVAAVTATGTCGAVAGPCMTLRANAAGMGTITRGDMIVRTAVGDFPNPLTYSVGTGGNCPGGQACIMRTDAAGAQVVATNIVDTGAGLQFRYVLDNGTEVDAPGDLSVVRAVRVSVSGQTVVTAAYMGGNTKVRTLESLAKVRNR